MGAQSRRQRTRAFPGSMRPLRVRSASKVRLQDILELLGGDTGGCYRGALTLPPQWLRAWPPRAVAAAVVVARSPSAFILARLAHNRCSITTSPHTQKQVLTAQDARSVAAMALRRRAAFLPTPIGTAARHSAAAAAPATAARRRGVQLGRLAACGAAAALGHNGAWFAGHVASALATAAFAVAHGGRDFAARPFGTARLDGCARAGAV